MPDNTTNGDPNPAPTLPRFAVEDYDVKVENSVEICILRSDGAWIPLCEGNRDYAEFREVDTDLHLCHRSVWPPPLTDPEKWAALKAQRNQLVLHVKGLAEIVLYLAETEAIKAGRITANQRTISTQRALKCALYLRDLFRIEEQSTDPDAVVLPTLTEGDAA